MRDIVKLCDDRVHNLWSIVPVRLLHLGAEMSKDDDSGLVWPNQDRPNKEFKMVRPLLIAIKQALVSIQYAL